MSTGLECEFIEWEAGWWYYVLQDSDCPRGAWDWREYATATGPFLTYEAAREHLSENHANPGGHSVYALTDVVDAVQGMKESASLTRLIGEAVSPEPPRFRRGKYPW